MVSLCSVHQYVALLLRMSSNKASKGKTFLSFQQEDAKTMKTKMREKVRPKMGKIDIDYQKLHDAFFKWQIKPKLTIHGDLYYEVILELVSYWTVWVALTFLWEVFPEEIFFSLSIFYLFFLCAFTWLIVLLFPLPLRVKSLRHVWKRRSLEICLMSWGSLWACPLALWVLLPVYLVCTMCLNSPCV